MRYSTSDGWRGIEKGCTILFLDKFKDVIVGDIPFTLVLSLRSITFKAVFLLLYKIWLSGCISILLISNVVKVRLVWISEISLSYLVNVFLFLI